MRPANSTLNITKPSKTPRLGCFRHPVFLNTTLATCTSTIVLVRLWLMKCMVRTSHKFLCTHGQLPCTHIWYVAWRLLTQFSQQHFVLVMEMYISKFFIFFIEHRSLILLPIPKFACIKIFLNGRSIIATNCQVSVQKLSARSKFDRTIIAVFWTCAVWGTCSNNFACVYACIYDTII